MIVYILNKSALKIFRKQRRCILVTHAKAIKASKPTRFIPSKAGLSIKTGSSAFLVLVLLLSDTLLSLEKCLSVLVELE